MVSSKFVRIVWVVRCVLGGVGVFVSIVCVMRACRFEFSVCCNSVLESVWLIRVVYSVGEKTVCFVKCFRIMSLSILCACVFGRSSVRDKIVWSESPGVRVFMSVVCDMFV